MATIEELETKVRELEKRLVALEATLFGARHGALETRSERVVPAAS